MVLDITRLDAVIMATVEVLKRNLLGKDRNGTERSVAANFDCFLDGDKAVDRLETAQGGQPICPLDGNCTRGDAGLQWIMVGFINLTCPSLASNS